jgi:hypothetical protein
VNISSDQLNLIAFALGPVIALVFFLLGLTAKKPRLIAAGSGGGTISVPGKDVMASNVSIRNDPTYLGFRIPREAANITEARLYNPALREFVGPVLRWRVEGKTELSQTASIQAGALGNLYLFAKERYAEDYFIYSANSLNSDPHRPLVRYNDPKKDFAVVLFDDIGRKYRFNLIIRNADQSINITFKITFGGRVRMVREAFALFIRAFSPMR